MFELNVNTLINQLCAAECTNGEMSAEIEHLSKNCEALTVENHALRVEISSLKEELQAVKTMKDMWWDKYQQTKALYESVTSDDPDKILVELPETLEG